MYRYFFYFLFVLLVLGCSAEENSPNSLTANKAESENNQEVENQSTYDSDEKTFDDESSLAELEGDFSLVPLTNSDCPDFGGAGCEYFWDDKFYMYAAGDACVRIAGDGVELEGEGVKLEYSRGGYRGEWRGQQIELEVIDEGERENFGEEPEQYSMALVELRLTKGDKVSSVQVYERCGD